MRINQEYVKQKVKNQLRNMNQKHKQKRNQNKDKKVMKARADIREGLHDFWLIKYLLFLV